MTHFDDNQIIIDVIPNFTHETGVHCTSSAVRNVFEFHGVKMTEAMVFGLGSGMSLGYLKIPRMTPFFGGRNRDFIKDLCDTLNITLNKFTSRKVEEGWLRLRSHLETQNPSVIDIDMGFLGYQKKFLPSDEFHCAWHGQHHVL